MTRRVAGAGPAVPRRPAGERTLMWEAKAAPGRGAELAAAVLAGLAPDDPAQVFAAAERVVVLTAESWPGPLLAAEVLARPAHRWVFQRLR